MYPKTAAISSLLSLFLNEGISPFPLVMIRIARASSAFQFDVRSVAPDLFPFDVLARPSEPWQLAQFAVYTDAPSATPDDPAAAGRTAK